jgi:hypothetical protein
MVAKAKPHLSLIRIKVLAVFCQSPCPPGCEEPRKPWVPGRVHLGVH